MASRLYSRRVIRRLNYSYGSVSGVEGKRDNRQRKRRQQFKAIRDDDFAAADRGPWPVDSDMLDYSHEIATPRYGPTLSIKLSLGQQISREVVQSQRHMVSVRIASFLRSRLA